MDTRSHHRPSSRYRRQRLAKWLTLVVALLVAASAGSALAQSQQKQEPIVVVAKEYSFTGPAQMAPGWHYIALKNEGREVHQLQFARLNEGVTADDFFASLKSEGESALRLTTLTGGVAETAPGASAETLADFTEPGTYVELCFIPNAEGVPHLALGMTGVVEVSGTPHSAEVPTPDVVVHLFDFGYKMSKSMTPGPHVWEVINDGPENHEMNVMKLNDGVSIDDFMKALEADNFVVPPMGILLGGAQGLAKGLMSYLDYDLGPGTYVLYCNIPDPATGKSHISLGMVSSFTVASAQN